LKLNGADDSQQVLLLRAFKTRCPTYITVSHAAPVEITVA
jgi:hypothetical protein